MYYHSKPAFHEMFHGDFVFELKCDFVLCYWNNIMSFQIAIHATCYRSKASGKVKKISNNGGSLSANCVSSLHPTGHKR